MYGVPESPLVRNSSVPLPYLFPTPSGTPGMGSFLNFTRPLIAVTGGGREGAEGVQKRCRTCGGVSILYGSGEIGALEFRCIC